MLSLDRIARDGVCLDIVWDTNGLKMCVGAFGNVNVVVGDEVVGVGQA
jgi:hypothetical protein